MVWLSIDDLFKILPNEQELSKGKYVILFLGFSKLVDMATSVNDQIIAYSKYFRFNFYTVLILAVLNIICNITLIPIYGMVGAALATFLSQSIYNLIKYLYLKYRFSFTPFNKKTLHLLIIGFTCFILTYWIPNVIHPLFSIALRSLVFGSLYLLLVLHFNISDDFKSLIIKSFGRFIPKSLIQ
jgi:O-antigen/teichoic acid export membrane protein